MNHGSLFSGIGGFDLAAEWMGWNNKFHCDINPFSRKLCSFYWPEAESYDNIKTTDFRIWRGKIDILSGGFPCQPFSTAGKRMGKEDERHLWPEFFRAIREIKPRYVVGENVRGFLNWSDGLVLEEVYADLESEGYEVQTFVLPAVGINAPHRRDRVYIIAHANSDAGRSGSSEGGRTECEASGNGESSIHLGSQSNGNEGNATKSSRVIKQGGPSETWDGFPIESAILWGDDGVSKKLVNFVVDDLYNKISNTSQENRIENLQEVWNRIQQEEIWENIRRFYSLESKEILFQTMQLYSRDWKPQKCLSPFGEDFCRPVLQHLQKYREFRCSPQGRELEKQRTEQFGNTLSFLPHEIALAAKTFEKRSWEFFKWHRKHSLVGYGNAIVPQIAYRIFATIDEIESQKS